MIKIKLTILITFLSQIISGQTIDLKGIEWGNKVIANDSTIIVAGFTFRNDGHGQTAVLYSFNPALHKKWEIRLDKFQTNTIDRLAFYKGSIILTGIYGVRTSDYVKAERYIKILNLKGKLINETNIGQADGKVTNMIILNDKLYFGYTKSSSYYADMMTTSRNAVVEFDLNTKKYSISEHYLVRSTTDRITSNSKDVFISGEQYKTEKYNVTETYFHNNAFAGAITNILPADKMEGLAQIVYEKDQFVLFSYSNPFIENQERYLRIDYLNKLGSLEKTVSLNFSQLGLLSISLDFPYIENQFWAYAFKTDEKSYFIRFDTLGKIIETIPSAMEDGATSSDFYVTPTRIIHLLRQDDIVKLQVVKR